MYAVKSLLQVTLHALEVVNVESSIKATRSSLPRAFRTFGEVCMTFDLVDSASDFGSTAGQYAKRHSRHHHASTNYRCMRGEGHLGG
jgi:hypothetical protein